jgi:hypothetical protein
MKSSKHQDATQGCQLKNWNTVADTTWTTLSQPKEISSQPPPRSQSGDVTSSRPPHTPPTPPVPSFTLQAPPPPPVPSTPLPRVPFTRPLSPSVLLTRSHCPFLRPPFMLALPYITRPFLVHDRRPPFLSSVRVRSLIVVPTTTPERGKDLCSEKLRRMMTFNLYRALISSEAEDNGIRGNHSSKVWKTVGNWLNSMNQLNMRDYVAVELVHGLGKLITERNNTERIPGERTGRRSSRINTEETPGERAGGRRSWWNVRSTTNMNRKTPKMVTVEEHEEVVNAVQTLQVQLRALSTQVLSITEITIQHRSEQQRTKDECEALRQQIEELKFISGPVSPVTTLSDEASSPGQCPHLDLNLRPPAEAEQHAPGQTRK